VLNLEQIHLMQNNYLVSIKKQFAYYKMLGDKSFEQIKEEDLFWQPNENSNSIAVIVNHLSGNMKSRWTDFLTSDGEKEWRNRDAEFEKLINSKTDLLEHWQRGWECVFTALDSINENNFETVIYIRNQGHTIVEAINRQLAHYAYHIGQIVFIAKMKNNEEWQSLSIPKGASKLFNSAKFKKAKHQAHFTDEFLERKKAD